VTSGLADPTWPDHAAPGPRTSPARCARAVRPGSTPAMRPRDAPATRPRGAPATRPNARWRLASHSRDLRVTPRGRKLPARQDEDHGHDCRRR